MGNRLVFICTVLLMSIHSFGQDANWLGFNDLKQNNPVLPGQLKSEEGLTIVLPGLSSTLFQSGVPIGDFLKETTPGVYQLDFSDVLDDIDASNKIQAEFKVPVIGVDYRKGANMFSLNYGCSYPWTRFTRM